MLGVDLGFAAGALIVVAGLYARVAKRRHLRRGIRGGLHRREILGVNLLIGAVAIAGGVLLVTGSTSQDQAGGVLLLLGGLGFCGLGLYSAWWLRP